jgi:hypothetical protein
MDRPAAAIGHVPQSAPSSSQVMGATEAIALIGPAASLIGAPPVPAIELRGMQRPISAEVKITSEGTPGQHQHGPPTRSPSTPEIDRGRRSTDADQERAFRGGSYFASPSAAR